MPLRARCPLTPAAALPSAHLPRPGGFSVFAGVGERTREGNDLYREMIEGGACRLCSMAAGWAVCCSGLHRRRRACPCRWSGAPSRGAVAPTCLCRRTLRPPTSLPAPLLRPAAAPPGVIKLGDQQADSKVTLVYGQMNEPPGARCLPVAGDSQPLPACAPLECSGGRGRGWRAAAAAAAGPGSRVHACRPTPGSSPGAAPPQARARAWR